MMRRYKTESCIISLQRRQPVETQNLASHEQRTRFLSAYSRQQILGLPSRETQNFASLLYANSATRHPSISAAYNHTATHHHHPRHPQLIFLTSANSTFSVLRSADSKFLSIFAVCYLYRESKQNEPLYSMNSVNTTCYD